MGYDLGYKEYFDHINQEVSKFYNKMHKIGSLIDGKENINPKYAKEHYCPARFADITAAIENEIKGAISTL